jgi:hypothetical protein
MNVKRFQTPEEFHSAVVRLLTAHLQTPGPAPRAIMLCAGKTPLPIYRQLTDHPVCAAENVSATPSSSHVARYGTRPTPSAIVGIPIFSRNFVSPGHCLTIRSQYSLVR